MSFGRYGKSSMHNPLSKALKASLLEELPFVAYGNGLDKYPVAVKS